MQDIRVAAVSTGNCIGQQARAIRNMAHWAEKARNQILFRDRN